MTQDLLVAARRVVQRSHFEFELDEHGSSFATGVVVPVEEFIALVRALGRARALQPIEPPMVASEGR